MKRVQEYLVNNLLKYKYLLIILTVLAAWSPVLFVSFINDDYQILGFHIHKDFLSVFQPFWKPDISNVYWRPLGNVIHPLMLNLFGFNPLPFRILSLVFYIVCCLVIYRTGEIIGVSKTTALFAALLFAVLPSHELQIAWIADQAEVLVPAFLLLAFNNYYRFFQTEKNPKYIFFGVTWFAAALLIKEVAFTGIFIPIIVYSLQNDYSKKKFFTALRDSGFALLILCTILLYRYIIIGGTPFSSSHFEGSGLLNWILNFFIYIPLAFVPPETLEFLLVHSKDLLIGSLIFIAAGIFIYLLIKYFIRIEYHYKKIIISGILWFIIFIVPAIPTLMRWYVFTASIGLIWILSSYFDFYVFQRKKQIYVYILIIILVSLTIYDFNLMLRWSSVSRKNDIAIQSLSSLKEEIKDTSIILLGIPDKIDRIPMMKLGIAQTVQYALNGSNVNVYAPLRTELTGDSSIISSVTKSDSSVMLYLNGGKFLIERTPSSSIFKNEEMMQQYENYEIRIKNFLNEKDIPASIAEITFNKKFRENEILFFDGRIFKELK